jgi:hypothetical protein
VIVAYIRSCTIRLDSLMWPSTETAVDYTKQKKSNESLSLSYEQLFLLVILFDVLLLLLLLFLLLVLVLFVRVFVCMNDVN